MTSRDDTEDVDTSTESFDTVSVRWDEYPTPSAAIVEQVAAATGKQPTALQPLYEVVEADALDTLLTSSSGPISVSFTYEGIEVRLRTDGYIGLSRGAAD